MGAGRGTRADGAGRAAGRRNSGQEKAASVGPAGRISGLAAGPLHGIGAGSKGSASLGTPNRSPWPACPPPSLPVPPLVPDCPHFPSIQTPHPARGPQEGRWRGGLPCREVMASSSNHGNSCDQAVVGPRGHSCLPCWEGATPLLGPGGGGLTPVTWAHAVISELHVVISAGARAGPAPARAGVLESRGDGDPGFTTLPAPGTRHPPRGAGRRSPARGDAAGAALALLQPPHRPLCRPPRPWQRQQPARGQTGQKNPKFLLSDLKTPELLLSALTVFLC